MKTPSRSDPSTGAFRREIFALCGSRSLPILDRFSRAYLRQMQVGQADFLFPYLADVHTHRFASTATTTRRCIFWRTAGSSPMWRGGTTSPRTSKCEKCGSTMGIVELRGDYLHARCRICGHAVEGMVARLPGILPDESWFYMRARWKGAVPSAAEIKVLRELFPDFRERGMAELVRALQQAPTVSLGRFVESRARELQEEALQRGLTVERDD
jgi:hypothetical protein